MIRTASYTNIGGRNCNEDLVVVRVSGDGVIALVADGLGGHGGGDIASRKAVEIISDGWSGKADLDKLCADIQTANAEILKLQTPSCRMKSTITAVSYSDGKCVWAHCGDSRIYRFHNNVLEFQTLDHSASQLAVYLGQITPAEIRFHEDRSRIIRALGQEEELKIDTGSLDLISGDKYAFLLCSDGFWEYVLEDEMEYDLKRSSTPGEWIRRMRRRLKARIPSDNDNNTAAAVWIY
ncbi:MAG: protein phosphatase 2C domain-containing protein [Oscillospiraceae bacterium]|nr:protein phosphatase 2C domain-containing protein [Oscillospiraceae bacterium]